ncbi:nucleoside-specific channel-forming protein tsx [Escherichia coli TA014]|nr:nucleoside-specific channel-forming protein tsx [Escherichia coli TA014]
MKKTLLAAGAVLALSSSFTVNAAENDKPQYLSDWWHQSVNVVGSYHTRFGPQLRNDTYLEYEAFAKKAGSTSMVMRMRRYSSAVTPMQKVSGTTVLRCLWKSNRVSPSTS